MGIFSGFCLFGPLKNSNGANAGPECGFLSPKMLMGCLLDDACEVWGDDSKKIFNPWGLAQVTQAPTHLPFQFWALAMPGHSLGSALGGPPPCSGARTGLYRGVENRVPPWPGGLVAPKWQINCLCHTLWAIGTLCPPQ